MKTYYSFALLLFLLFTACTDHEENVKVEPLNYNSDLKALTTTYNNQAIKLFNEVATNPAENHAISPVGILQVLGMAANGADGSTQTQILNFAGADNMMYLNNMCESLHTRLAKVDPSKCTIKEANSVWVQKGYSLNKDYTAGLSNVFGGKITTVDLNSADFVDKINSWTKKNTENMIDKVLDTPLTDAKLCLANTLYFYGKWAEPFKVSDTKPGKFYITPSQTVNADFMTKTIHSGFYADNDKYAVILPYGNRAFSCIITDLEVNGNDDIEHFINNQVQDFATLKLPKFDIFANNNKLLEAIKSQGVNDMWHAQLANFSRSGIDNLYFNTLIHKVRVIVDEQGTKAAAVTATGGLTSAGPMHYNIVFDHPFTFVIRENSSGLILFIGKVNNP